MDGNGRWAKARGLPRTAGHQRGAEAVRRTLKGAIELGISYLTLFGFSSENWKRPDGEVQDLMGLLRYYLETEVQALHKNGIRLSVIGDRSRFSASIQRSIAAAEELTQGNRRLYLQIALSYGARDEIVEAARRLAAAAQSGKLDPAQIDESAFSRALMTDGVPDPDLIIRTSGERRLSNFLLWQSAYAELLFVDKLWPDFGKDDLESAIRDYHGRERRYGSTAV